MFISENHFLLPFTMASADSKIIKRLMGVDTELMVGMRLVGYDSGTGRPVIDLLKIDGVYLDIGSMPEGLSDLLPEPISGKVVFVDSSKDSLENYFKNLGLEY